MQESCEVSREVPSCPSTSREELSRKVPAAIPEAVGFPDVFQAIRADQKNLAYAQRGINPLYTAGPNARIVIVGQAPGRIAQDTQIPWNDKSGERLRDWLGMDRSTFYNHELVSIMPMDFYFPGSGKSGDLPPRKGFAEKWHPLLLERMPQVRLAVLVGSYAARYYLELKSKDKLTDVVRDYRRYLPKYFPLVHPSPRNQAWFKHNPWFQDEVVPELRRRVQDALA